VDIAVADGVRVNEVTAFFPSPFGGELAERWSAGGME
jgi:hypothetical protein